MGVETDFVSIKLIKSFSISERSEPYPTVIAVVDKGVSETVAQKQVKEIHFDEGVREAVAT